MLIKEIMTESIKEGVIQIWGRNKGKLVRKYRCTSGSRKGRIVAQPVSYTHIRAHETPEHLVCRIVV